MMFADRDRFTATRFGIEGIARVGSANMRADRAAQANPVVRVIGEIIVSGECRFVLVRRLGQGRAALPSANHFCGETVGSGWVALAVGSAGCLIQELPETDDVLAEGSEDEVAAIEAEVTCAARAASE